MSGDSRKIWRLALAGVVIGAVAGGVGVAAASVMSDDKQDVLHDVGLGDPEGAPVNYVETIQNSGPGKSGVEALSEVLRRMSGTKVQSLEFSDATSQVPHLEAIVSGQDSGAEGIDLTWQASLAQGAVADLMRERELATSDVINGLTVTFEGAQGPEVVDEGRGYVAAGQVFGSETSGESDAEVKARVSSAVKTFGLSEVSVEVLHPLGDAVSVRATLPSDTKVDWTLDDLRGAIAGEPKDFEGIFIEISDSRGQPLLAAGVSYRSGLGGLWFAPGQDSVFGANHGGAGSTQ